MGAAGGLRGGSRGSQLPGRRRSLPVSPLAARDALPAVPGRRRPGEGTEAGARGGPLVFPSELSPEGRQEENNK